MGAAVASALPVLPALAGPDGQLAAVISPELKKVLRKLEQALSDAGAGEDNLARLVSVLCDHARIRDCAAGNPDLALSGLKAMVDVMLESLSPGRDGLALNALVGLDNKLDPALLALRTKCVSDFMLGRCDSADEAAVAAAVHSAGELVALEADLASARVQMLQAFEAAGIPRTMGGIAGLKLTPALVRRLRSQQGLGKHAGKVGLAIANVYLFQRRIAESSYGQQMLSDALMARSELMGQKDKHDLIRYLDQRIASLEPEAEAPSSNESPNESLGGLTDEELKRLGLQGDAVDPTGRETSEEFEARKKQTRKTICKLAAQGLSGAAQTQNATRTINAVMQAWLKGNGLAHLADGGLAVLSAGRSEDRAKLLGRRLMERTRDKGLRHLRQLESVVREEIEPAKQQLALRDDAAILAMRKRYFGPDLHATLRDAVRAAALLQLGTTPLHKFVPADHTPAVWNTLFAWGIETRFAGPEIDAILGEDFNVNTLDQWIAEADLPPEYEVEQFSEQVFLEKLDDIKIGTRLKFTAGNRVEVQTGYIPVDPLFLLETNIKAGGGTSTALEIARVVDGGVDVYELTFRAGYDLKLGAELWLNGAQSRITGIDADVMVTAEGSHQRLKGVTLRFGSKEALKAAMTKLLASTSESPVTPADLHHANSILPLVENKTAGKASIGAKVGIDVGTRQVGGDSDARHVGATASLRAVLQGGRTKTNNTSLNTVESVEKSETETVVEGSLTALAGAEFKAGPSVDQTTWSAVMPTWQAGVTVASVVKRKRKIFRGRDGSVQAGTERVSQSYLRGGSGLAAAARIGGKPFVRLMEELRTRDKPAADAIEALVASAQNNELLSIASTLDPVVGAQVNALLRAARNHRTGRAGAGTARQGATRAKELERQARNLLDDKSSYLIARISLIPTAERLETLTQLNLVLLQKNKVMEERSEFIAMEVKPDLAISTKVRDDLRAAKAARKR